MQGRGWWMGFLRFTTYQRMERKYCISIFSIWGIVIGFLIYWDSIDKTYDAFLYQERVLAEILQKRTDLVSTAVPLTSSFTLKILGCMLDCFQICSSLWNCRLNNKMNIVKSQLQQCSNTPASKLVRCNWDILALKGCLLCARGHVYKQEIKHHFSMDVEELHCMKYFTIHLVEQTSCIFQQNTRQKHTENVFIAKILPQGKWWLSKSKIYTNLYIC